MPSILPSSCGYADASRSARRRSPYSPTTLNGCFSLSGVDPALMAQIDHNRTLEQAGNVRVFEVTKVVGETSLVAYHAARARLADIEQDSADE
jgi:hypothetical protein